MAEVTALRNNVMGYPIYGLPYASVFPILDADGDPVTGAAALDSEISLNGDTAADCTNEATEIATSTGSYYLVHTAAEMTTDVALVQVKTSTSGAKTTVLALYPRKLPAVSSGTATAGAAGTITLQSSGAVARDDHWNGCVIYISSGTGSGQCRMITDYVGSTRVANVTPNWATNPSSDSVYTIYATEVSVATFTAKGADGLNLLSTDAQDLSATLDVNAKKLGGATPNNLSSTTVDSTITANALLIAIAGYIDTEVAAIKAKTDNLPSDPADASDIAASFASVSSTLSTIAGYIDTEVAAIKAKTDNLPADPADASDIAASFASVASTLSTIAGYIDTEVAAIKAKTDNLPSDPADESLIIAATDALAVSIAALPAAVGARQITEGYRANGAAPTNDQAVSELLGHLGEADIVGTTKTIKKFDHSTSAATFTLTVDGNGDVTAITRAT